MIKSVSMRARRVQSSSSPARPAAPNVWTTVFDAACLPGILTGETTIKAVVNRELRINRQEAGQCTFLPNAGLMLGQRRWRWPNIKSALGQDLLFSGLLGKRRIGVHLFWRSIHRRGYLASAPYSITIKSIRLCKAKRHYLLTCKVGRYCLLALYGSATSYWRNKYKRFGIQYQLPNWSTWKQKDHTSSCILLVCDFVVEITADDYQ